MEPDYASRAILPSGFSSSALSRGITFNSNATSKQRVRQQHAPVITANS